MGCLIGSLAVVLVLVHLPIERVPGPVGWNLVRGSTQDIVSLQDLDWIDPAKREALITRYERRVAEAEPEEGNVRRPAAENNSPGSTEARRSHFLKGLKALQAAPQMPEIVGGIGAFYVHIEYPEEAIEQEIEGRLVLSFIVTRTGETDDIHVIEPLHPLCDSAAVAALRDTRFVPGRRNGENVAVRMRLPVRFRLVMQDSDHTAELD